MKCWYASTEVNLLLDVCSFLDPRFQGNFSIDDEAVQTKIIEMEQCGFPNSTSYQMTLDQSEITIEARASLLGTDREQTEQNLPKIKKESSVLFLEQVYQVYRLL